MFALVLIGLVKYSGILVVLSAWLLLVIPYLIYKGKYNLRSISEEVLVPQQGYLVSLGIILSSLFQIIYSYILININTSLISVIGGIIITISSVVFLLAAYFDVIKNYKIHIFLIRSYAILLMIGLIMVNISFFPINFTISLIGLLLLVVGSIFSSIYNKQNDFLYAEIFVIIVTSLWALLVQIYFI